MAGVLLLLGHFLSKHSMSQSFFLEVLCLNFSPGQKIKHLRSMAVTSILQNSALRIENLVLPYQLLRCCRPLFRLMQVAPPSDWFSKCAFFMNVPHLCVITHRNVVTCSTRDVLNCAKQSFVPVWVCQSFFFKRKKSSAILCYHLFFKMRVFHECAAFVRHHSS